MAKRRYSNGRRRYFVALVVYFQTPVCLPSVAEFVKAMVGDTIFKWACQSCWHVPVTRTDYGNLVSVQQTYITLLVFNVLRRNNCGSLAVTENTFETFKLGETDKILEKIATPLAWRHFRNKVQQIKWKLDTMKY